MLAPHAVCILSKIRVGPLTANIFGKHVGPDPVAVTVGKWTGLIAVAPQPIRGGAPETKGVIRRLLRQLFINRFDGVHFQKK